MASVTNTIRKRPMPCPHRVVSTVLHLTGEEALFLSSVLARVGGDPVASRRKHATAILAALAILGEEFERPNNDDIEDRLGCRSAIYFRNLK